MDKKALVFNDSHDLIENELLSKYIYNMIQYQFRKKEKT